MKTGILITIFLFIFLSCSKDDKQKKVENSPNTDKEYTFESKDLKLKKLDNYKWIHDFKLNSGEFLGSLFINQVNDSIFNSLRILKESETMYKIDHFDFWNTKGIDFDVPKDTTNFYGYIIRLLGNSHLVIGYCSNNGKNVADDQTLIWNDKEKVFNIMITP